MNSNGLVPFAGFLCPLLFVGFFVLAIVVVIRMVRSGTRVIGGSGVSAPPPVNVPTRLEQDGFWMISCPVDPGAIIYYHYWSAGVRYSGQVPFKPEADGRQFVYTGRRPDQVSVVRIVEVDDDGGVPGAALIPPTIPIDPTWEVPDSPSSPASSSSSFPSAY